MELLAAPWTLVHGWFTVQTLVKQGAAGMNKQSLGKQQEWLALRKESGMNTRRRQRGTANKRNAKKGQRLSERNEKTGQNPILHACAHGAFRTLMACLVLNVS